MGILTQMIDILVDGLEGIGLGIGSSLSKMAEAIFVNTTGDTQTLTTFGGLVVCFSALSLGFSLTRWVLNFITSFGQRNS